MAKLHASETAMRCTWAAVQTLGGWGYSREYPVEKWMRDAKLEEIEEGTSDIQRLDHLARRCCADQTPSRAIACAQRRVWKSAAPSYASSSVSTRKRSPSQRHRAAHLDARAPGAAREPNRHLAARRAESGSPSTSR